MRKIVMLAVLILGSMFEPATGISLCLVATTIVAWRYSASQAFVFAWLLGLIQDVIQVRPLGFTSIACVLLVLAVQLFRLRFGESVRFGLLLILTVADWLYRWRLGIPWTWEAYLGMLLITALAIWLTSRIDTREGVYLKQAG